MRTGPFILADHSGLCYKFDMIGDSEYSWGGPIAAAG